MAVKIDYSKVKSELLLDEYDNISANLTKAANGWNNKSEARLSRELEVIREEILKRMSKK